jgi:hypothetical protein
MLLKGSLLLGSKAANGEKVLFGQKAIADAAYRFEKLRLRRVVFDVTAQTDHEVIDGARIRVLAYSPDLFQQLLARDDATPVLYQVSEEV